jgi:hypothetical protein
MRKDDLISLFEATADVEVNLSRCWYEVKAIAREFGGLLVPIVQKLVSLIVRHNTNQS